MESDEQRKIRMSRALGMFYEAYTDMHRMSASDALEALGAFVAFTLLMHAIDVSTTKRDARAKFVSLMGHWNADMVDSAVTAAEDVLSVYFDRDAPSGAPTIGRPR